MQNSKQKVVQFNELSSANKDEFLEFLARNNISFQMGEGVYTATVALPNGNPNEKPSRALGNRNMNSFANANRTPGKGDTILKDKKLWTPINRKQQSQRQRTHESKIRLTPKQTIKVMNDENVIDGTVFTPTGIKQYNCSYSPTLKRSEDLNRKSSHSAKKDKENFVKLNAMNAGVKRKSKEQTLKRKKTFHNKPSAKKQLMKSKDSIEFESKHQDTIKTSNFQQYRSPERRKIDSVEKYLGLFSFNLKNQRPVKWPRQQLDRFIEEIYTKSFIRNTQLLQKKQFEAAFKNNQNLNTHFANFIQKDFKKKFNTDKLIQFNLSSMLYTLASFLEKENAPLPLRIFEDFLRGNYLYEDLIFFLFARNRIEKQLNLNFVEFSEKQKFYRPEDNPKLEMKLKDIKKLLKCIIGKDSQMLEEYEEMIMKNIQKNYLNSEQIENKGSVNIFFIIKVLMEDYKDKRICDAKEFESCCSDVENSNGKLSETLRKMSHRHLNEMQTEEMTFGEETEENMYQDEKDFWEEQNTQPEDPQETGSLESNEFHQIITEKLQRKVQQFIEILASEQSQALKENLLQLVTQKASSLLNIIFQMSKLKWFKQLKVCNPDDHDIETIQKLQLSLRNLKRNPDFKDIGEFCKQILTVKQVTNQLSKLLM